MKEAESASQVALVTCRRLQGLTDDDRLLVEPLRSAGVDARAATWDDRSEDWNAFGCAVVRSTWDYHVQPARFRRWIDRSETAGVRLWNPARLLRWNMDKRYLRDLEARGVPVVPTVWLERGSSVDFSSLLNARGWERAVVKPAVSAGARRTSVVRSGDGASAQRTLNALLSRGDVMVQPFLDTLEAEGEWSLVFLGGSFSHAALKRPAAGDFRVQERFGGTVESAIPPRPLVRQAEAVLEATTSAAAAAANAPAAAVGAAAAAAANAPAVATAAAGAGTAVAPSTAVIPPEDLLYARVDGVVEGGCLRLLEMEVLEPSLFLALDPSAPARLARAIVERLA